MSLLSEHRYYVGKGPQYEDGTSLPKTFPTQSSIRFIAYYLPQFHFIKENELHWGEGFTEWTNVTKALPRFRGHYQPRLPGSLGFYNLSEPNTIRAQVDLARRGGINGFCFHFYWFSGRRLLERPVDIFLRDKSIDMPFCINWANESWTKRWDGSEKEVIVPQQYHEDDPDALASDLCKVFEDYRYIKVNGRPLVMIYKPTNIPNTLRFISIFRRRVKALIDVDPYIIMAMIDGRDDYEMLGLDGVGGFPPHNVGFFQKNIQGGLKKFDHGYSGQVITYKQMMISALGSLSDNENTFPGVCPSWDNEARKPNRGFTVLGSTPKAYGNWLRAAGRQALMKPDDKRIVFINAWNEWAEGAYLEPDRHFGYAYLSETRRALDDLNSSRKSSVRIDDYGAEYKTSYWSLLKSKYFSILKKLRT